MKYEKNIVYQLIAHVIDGLHAAVADVAAGEKISIDSRDCTLLAALARARGRGGTNSSFPPCTLELRFVDNFAPGGGADFISEIDL